MSPCWKEEVAPPPPFPSAYGESHRCCWGVIIHRAFALSIIAPPPNLPHTVLFWPVGQPQVQVQLGDMFSFSASYSSHWCKPQEHDSLHVTVTSPLSGTSKDMKDVQYMPRESYAVLLCMPCCPVVACLVVPNCDALGGHADLQMHKFFLCWTRQ